MLRFFRTILWISGLFLASCQAAPSGQADRAATEPQSGDYDDLCAAARKGDGKAQFLIGQALADEVETHRPKGLQKLRRPDRFDAQKTGRKEVAAALTWLDMAASQNVSGAKDLRAAVGLQARPADFQLYGSYSRMGLEAPCLTEEISGTHTL